MPSGRGKFLKSLEENVSLLRPLSANDRKIIYRKFKAICLVSRPSDDSRSDTNLFINTYTVNIWPEMDLIGINDLIIRWKMLSFVDEDIPTDEELLDARVSNIGDAVLTVLHSQTNRGKQQLRCKALSERIV